MARHQLCMFQVVKDLHNQALDPLRRMRRPLARRGRRGRKPKRGRRCEARARRRGLTHQEKSAVIFQRRYLIVKRGDRMSAQEPLHHQLMISDFPELKTLRTFVARLVMLFEEGQSLPSVPRT
jgi:hypothetical protein